MEIWNKIRKLNGLKVILKNMIYTTYFLLNLNLLDIRF